MQTNPAVEQNDVVCWMGGALLLSMTTKWRIVESNHGNDGRIFDCSAGEFVALLPFSKPIHDSSQISVTAEIQTVNNAVFTRPLTAASHMNSKANVCCF